MKTRVPVRWFGGKGLKLHILLPLVPPHKIYVEPFGGAAALLFAKPPSPVEVYNDIDSGLVNFFRVLRDPQKFERFYQKAVLTPYSREEFEFCRATWASCEDDVERAYRWFVVARMAFGGAQGGDLQNASWGYAITLSTKNMAATTRAWITTLKNLPWFHERILRVQIEHDDFRKVIPRYDTPETFFYCDPPYVPEARRSGKYGHEMTVEDHRELVDLLLNIKGMAILSGYRHPVYEPLEREGWERRDFSTVCSATGRTRGSRILGSGALWARVPRIESVWICPKTQEALRAKRLAARRAARRAYLLGTGRRVCLRRPVPPF